MENSEGARVQESEGRGRLLGRNEKTGGEREKYCEGRERLGTGRNSVGGGVQG